MNRGSSVAQRAPRGRAVGSGGISKRVQPPKNKVDKDGDLNMDGNLNIATRGPRNKELKFAVRGGAPRRGDGDVKMRGVSGSGVMRAMPTTRPHARGSGLVEVTVLGLKNTMATIEGLVEFLERKAKLKIKKWRQDGDALIALVPPVSSSALIQLDGVRFAGTELSITANNAPQIMPKREDNMIAMATPESKDKSDTIKLLESVLASRYNPERKLLDLSRLGEDPSLKASGIFNLESTTSKMFPAMMLVADRTFENEKDKKEAVKSVSLAYNNLKDVRVVTTLASTFPELQNLSLEGNMISSWKDLEPWKHKFRQLQELILTGNPIASTEGYQDEMMRRYSKLRLLDGVILERPVVKIGADTSASKLPLPVKGGSVSDVNGLGINFLSSFFTLYDSDRNTLLDTFYDDTSQFSMSANTQAMRIPQQGVSIPPNPWTPYFPSSRNLNRVPSIERQVAKLYVGRNRIRDAWNSLPAAKHDLSSPNKWVYDMYPIEGLPDINNPSNADGVTGLIVMVHGEFEEVAGLKRSFDRTFTLGPGNGPHGIRVVNDIMVVRPWGGFDAWKTEPEAAKPTPINNAVAQTTGSNTQQVIIELGRRTGLNIRYAEMCLQSCNWNFEAALRSFEAAKPNLPAEAFIPVQV